MPMAINVDARRRDGLYSLQHCCLSSGDAPRKLVSSAPSSADNQRTFGLGLTKFRKVPLFMSVKIDDLLRVASSHGASDLHVKVGSFPVMRIAGELHPI